MLSARITIVLTAALLCTAIVSLALVRSAAADSTYQATLSGSNEVSSASAGTSGTFSLSVGNASSTTSSTTMSYSLQAQSSAGRIIAAHLHCGDPGENGPVVVPLYTSAASSSATSTSASSTSSITKNANIAQSDITSADCQSTIGSTITTMQDLLQAIRSGRIYANVHTDQYPNGAARGQLMLPGAATTTPTTTTPTSTTTPSTSTSTPSGTTTPPAGNEQTIIILLMQLRNTLLQLIQLLHASGVNAGIPNSSTTPSVGASAGGGSASAHTSNTSATAGGGSATATTGNTSATAGPSGATSTVR